MTIESFLWMLATLLFMSWKIVGCLKRGKDKLKKDTLTGPTSGMNAAPPQGTSVGIASAPQPTLFGGASPFATGTTAASSNLTPAVPVQATHVATQNPTEDEQQYEDVTIDDRAGGGL